MNFFRKLIGGMLVVAAVAMLADCKNEDIYLGDADKAKYNRTWEELMGNTTLKKTWNTSQEVKGVVDVNWGLGYEFHVKVFTDHPHINEDKAFLLADYVVQDGDRVNLDLTAPAGLEYLYVACQFPDNARVVNKVKLANGMLENTRFGSMNPRARAVTDLSDFGEFLFNNFYEKPETAADGRKTVEAGEGGSYSNIVKLLCPRGDTSFPNDPDNLPKPETSMSQNYYIDLQPVDVVKKISDQMPDGQSIIGNEHVISDYEILPESRYTAVYPVTGSAEQKLTVGYYFYNARDLNEDRSNLKDIITKGTFCDNKTTDPAYFRAWHTEKKDTIVNYSLDWIAQHWWGFNNVNKPQVRPFIIYINDPDFTTGKYRIGFWMRITKDGGTEETVYSNSKLNETVDAVMMQDNSAFKSKRWSSLLSLTDEDGTTHQILGFESGRHPTDYDFNDIMFMTSGIPINPNSTPDKGQIWTLAYEDLGAIGDYDFNDVVLRIRHIAGNSELSKTADLWAVAAGGTLPVGVYYLKDPNLTPDQVITSDFDDTNKFTPLWPDLHKAFKEANSLPYDLTKMMLNTDDDKYIRLYNFPTASIDADMLETTQNTTGRIMIRVTKEDGKVINVTTPQKEGDAPQGLLIDGEWRWPKERSYIYDAYPKIKGDWGASNFSNFEWYTIDTEEQKAYLYQREINIMDTLNEGSGN
ncbi:LruC domain-containing protein [uncultured Bacteroides sp.]|uniref:LruC domain-containing protein n=1 Tax=uncultured Bacteroides sp. TaxID=162156 RepID=UPI002623CB16|nr:LruC domain-containing protein [uncultured Bacteroides sp.]